MVGSWAPLFDDQVFWSIGDIEIDPTDPDVVYVGTGDPQYQQPSWHWQRIFKSIDGGLTWQHLGLEEQRIIPRCASTRKTRTFVYATAAFLLNAIIKGFTGRRMRAKLGASLVYQQSGRVIDLAMHPKPQYTLRCWLGSHPE